MADEQSAVKLHRVRKIEEYIKKHGSVSVDDLCQHFAVSKNTIRRDLTELEARQLVKKVYGGVMAQQDDGAPIPLSQRQLTFPEEKTRIARKAAELVNDGDIIVLDAGSTTARMVEYLKTKRNLTLITNSIPVLTNALPHEQMHVIVTGGDVLRATNSLVGLGALAMLKTLNAHTLFLAATGVSLTKGITNSSTMELEIKRTMLDISERVVLLADHSKFEMVSLVTVADLKEVDLVITDQPPVEKYFQYCAAHAVEIVVAAQ